MSSTTASDVPPPGAGNEPPRVTVIVAVFNPGPYLELPLASLARQTMPPGEWEAIFVDDGSTDESGARLDELAATNPHIRVRHIPNSGWPGTPRNVALDEAHGRYVLILDHDDWLGTEALERMADHADRLGADVVCAKEVGHGFGVPVAAFARSVDDARLGEDPLLTLLTPHKLFRRSMLDEHRIRFPEGRRRLEDHLFVLPTYFAARRVSILADYPYYHWTRRENNANASYTPVDPVGYYDAVREILDILDRNTQPGPLRDRLYAHWYRNKTLLKLRGPRWETDAPTAATRRRFAEIRTITEERFPERIDRDLPIRFRIAARLVRADRIDLAPAYVRHTAGVRAEVSLVHGEARGGLIHLELRCALVDRDGPMKVLARDGAPSWQLPPPLDDPVLRAEDLDATKDLASASVVAILRHREARVEFSREFPLAIERDGDGGPVVGTAAVGIDLATFADGAPLSDGTWDAILHVLIGGWRGSLPLPAGGLATAGAGRVMRAYVNMRGNLSIKVEGSTAPAFEMPPHVDLPVSVDAGMAVRAVRERSLRSVLRRILPPRARQSARRLLERLGLRPGA